MGDHQKVEKGKSLEVTRIQWPAQHCFGDLSNFYSFPFLMDSLAPFRSSFVCFHVLDCSIFFSTLNAGSTVENILGICRDRSASYTRKKKTGLVDSEFYVYLS